MHNFVITLKKGEMSALSSAMAVAAAFLNVSAQCEPDKKAAANLKKWEEKLWEMVRVEEAS